MPESSNILQLHAKAKITERKSSRYVAQATASRTYVLGKRRGLYTRLGKGYN